MIPIYNHPWLVTSFEEETNVVDEPSDDHFVVSDIGTDSPMDSLFFHLKERYQEYGSFPAYRKLMSQEELELESKLIQDLKDGKEIPAQVHIKRFLTGETADALLAHLNMYTEPRGMYALSAELGRIKTYDEMQSLSVITPESRDTSIAEIIGVSVVGLIVVLGLFGVIILVL